MSAVTVPAGAELCYLPVRFPLARGGALDSGLVAFARTGACGGPLVVVLGGISAGRQVAGEGGWWDALVGPGRAVDTRRFAVLGVDWLGAPGASTSPRAGERFPFVATEDQAAALAAVLDGLDVARVHAVVGASYGGMVALQFAARWPARLERLAVLAAAHASHPQASAWRSVQRRILALGRAAGQERAAVALARSLALVTYRAPDQLGERFAGPWADGDDGEPWPPVADWLAHHGERFAARWNAAQYACLCASVDAHRVDPARISAPTTTIAFASDRLVTPQQVRELAVRLSESVRHIELPSAWGHDGFLHEPAALAPLLREVLR